MCIRDSNWWMNRSFLIRVNYVRAHTDPTTNQVSVGAGVDQSVNVFEGRFQVVF